MRNDPDSELCLYTRLIELPDGTEVANGYAYGESWIGMALALGDIIFDTPEEAREYWEKNYGKEETE